MSSVKTPNYILKEEHNLGASWNQDKVLPAGAFIKPIHKTYVPLHILEAWFGVNYDTHDFCYTRLGIVPIPKYKIREV